MLILTNDSSSLDSFLPHLEQSGNGRSVLVHRSGALDDCIELGLDIGVQFGRALGEGCVLALFDERSGELQIVIISG